MHKLTLLAAVGAVAVSGCDFSSSDNQFTTEAAIASVEVSDLSPRYRGANWDSDGNPDVFIEIRNAAGRAFYRSDVVSNADVSESFSFDVSDVMVASPTMPLFVAVFDMDEDLVHSQEMATSASFTAADIAAGSLQLADEGRSTRARFEVRSAGTGIEVGGDL